MKDYLYRKYYQLKYKHKLFLSYIVVVIIPISILGIYSYHQSKDMLYYQTVQGIQKNVDTTVEGLNADIKRNENLINLILYNSVIQKILSNDYQNLVNLSLDLHEYLNPYFNTIINLNKEVEKLTIYTENEFPEYGTYIQKSERVKNKEWYQETLENKTKINWNVNSRDLFASIKFSEVFTNRNNSILYLSLDYKGFFRDLDEALEDYGVLILDDEGKIIYANQLAERDLDIDSSEMQQTVDMTQMDKKDFIVFNKDISNTNWHVSCFVPVKKVTKNAGKIINATVIIILICIIILLILIHKFSNLFIKRIDLLNDSMEKVEKGELDLHISTSSTDEIGVLTNKFGNMVKKVNELINEVYRNKLIQKEAELKALRAQVNPHFLYNTLSFINWHALKNESYDLSHIVTTLSTFYRTALNKGDDIISIKDELQNIKSYVDIILITSDYSFTVTYNIDEEVNQYYMINLILQPIVENAIKHGVKQKKDGRGEIKVSAFKNKETIDFIVEDNGPGIQEELLLKLLSLQTYGYGLKNVNERIILFFGQRYGLTISSKEGLGTSMKVELPLYTKE